MNANDLAALGTDDKTTTAMIPGIINSKWSNPLLLGSGTTTNALASVPTSPKAFQSRVFNNDPAANPRSPNDNLGVNGNFTNAAASLKTIPNQHDVSPHNSVPNLNLGSHTITGNIGSLAINGSANTNSQVNLARYNPITNPVPNNQQNPYVIKNMQHGGSYQPKNYFAVMANNNLVSTKQ